MHFRPSLLACAALSALVCAAVWSSERSAPSPTAANGSAGGHVCAPASGSTSQVASEPVRPRLLPTGDEIERQWKEERGAVELAPSSRDLLRSLADAYDSRLHEIDASLDELQDAAVAAKIARGEFEPVAPDAAPPDLDESDVLVLDYRQGSGLVAVRFGFAEIPGYLEHLDSAAALREEAATSFEDFFARHAGPSSASDSPTSPSR